MKKLLLLLALLGLATPAAAQNPFSLINFGANPVDTNSGNKSNGTLRVLLATDGPNPTTVFKIDLSGTGANGTAILVTGTGGTFPVTGTVALSNSFLLDATYTGRTPAGASPADAESNTNANLSRFGAFLFGYNGTTWDRLRADTTNGLWVNVKASTSLAVTGTFFQSTQPISIVDGGDTTLGAKADAKSTATDTTAVSIMSVLKEISALEQAPASRAVTNAGTFPVQATLQTQTDTVMVGGVNVKEINGVTPLMGAGATGPGASRVNDVASSATGAAPPASATYVGGLGSGATGGFLIGPSVGDTGKVINVSTATTTLMITGVSGRQVHITSFHMLTAGANNVAWLEGTGATCGTGTAGMAGGTTAASGYNFAANGGIAMGTGIGDVLRTATTGDSVCLITSAAVQLSGFIEYAIY